jgi:hypothetical protein
VPHPIHLSDESRDTVRQLPADALKAFAELLDLLALDPWAGAPYREPDSDLRTAVVGDGAVLVVWLPLELPRRVEVLRVVAL